ncbi:MAG: SHOCT domain-containing protein [Rubrobacter sp.]|nr:SHOCT domain-containing protein [Rubrobacter sp.]
MEQIDQPSGLAGKLFELNELKEAGLITPEEFEAKKKDLLDRL